MVNLLLNPSTRNFVITGYNLTLTSTQQQWMAQKLLIRISMFLGGWYLNTTLGLPYLPVPGQPQITAILGSKNPEPGAGDIASQGSDPRNPRDYRPRAVLRLRGPEPQRPAAREYLQGFIHRPDARRPGRHR